MADTGVPFPESHTGDNEHRDNTHEERNTTSPSTSIKNTGDDEGFKPGLRVWLAFLTLAVLTLMVALDGTSISVALPV